jgi:hypothetical protein
MIFVAQLITLLLALAGTFFDGVEKDANGNRKWSRLGFPILTTAGRCVVILMLISSGTAVWKEIDNKTHNRPT